MLRFVTTEGVERERFFTLYQFESALRDQEMLVVMDLTNRAVTGMRVQNPRGFNSPLNISAMAAP